MNSPPAVTDRPSGSVAVADAVWMLIEIAAATSTAEPPESEVVAFGVDVFPESEAPFELAVLLPKPSWSFDCLFVSPALFEFLSFAPAALATESASLAEAPWALKLTAPPPARFRAVVALTRWLATVRPRAAPMPTLSPLAEPSASLDADAVCVAASVIEPVVVSSVPTPIVAEVVTFESMIATSAVTATPPAAPFLAKPVASVRRRRRCRQVVGVRQGHVVADRRGRRVVQDRQRDRGADADRLAGRAVQLRLRLVRRDRRRGRAQADIAAAGVHDRAGSDRSRRVDRDDPDRHRACHADRPGRRTRRRLRVERARHVGAVHRLQRREHNADRAHVCRAPDLREVRDRDEVDRDRRTDAERPGIRRGAVGGCLAVRVLGRAEGEDAAGDDREPARQCRGRRGGLDVD